MDLICWSAVGLKCGLSQSKEEGMQISPVTGDKTVGVSCSNLLPLLWVFWELDPDRMASAGQKVWDLQSSVWIGTNNYSKQEVDAKFQDDKAWWGDTQDNVCFAWIQICSSPANWNQTTFNSSSCSRVRTNLKWGLSSGTFRWPRCSPRSLDRCMCTVFPGPRFCFQFQHLAVEARLESPWWTCRGPPRWSVALGTDREPPEEIGGRFGVSRGGGRGGTDLKWDLNEARWTYKVCGLLAQQPHDSHPIDCRVDVGKGFQHRSLARGAFGGGRGELQRGGSVGHPAPVVVLQLKKKKKKGHCERFHLRVCSG